MNIRRNIFAAALAFIALGVSAQTKFIASGGGAGSGGTVTSVGVTVPAGLTAAGGPVTTTGTIAIDWDSVLPGRFLAGGCTGGSAAPLFRILCIDDLGALFSASNDPSTLVYRGPSGEFSAGEISATLLGNAATATTAENLSGTNLTGDVTNSDNAITLDTVNGNVGSFTAANITVNAKGLVTAAANGSAGTSPPFVDTTSLVEGSADATKELRFETDGFTTGTVRVLTPQNRDYTLAGMDAANTAASVFGWSGLGISQVSGSVLAIGTGADNNADGFLTLSGMYIIQSGSTTLAHSAGYDTNGDYRYGSAAKISWTNGGVASVSPDLAISRSVAGVLAVGTGAAGNTAGTVIANRYLSSGTAPGVAGSCGTSPSIAGKDQTMVITAGTAAPTSCTVTFNVAFATAPVCNANAETTTTTLNVVTTTTTVVVSAAALTASEKIYVTCFGY